MASGLSSPLGIAGIIFIIIGIIMAVVGIILLIANQNKSKSWYIWFLLIAGIVLGIAGGIMVAVALSYPTQMIQTVQTVQTVRTVPVSPPIQTIQTVETVPQCVTKHIVVQQ